jgi:hypothetical protein
MKRGILGNAVAREFLPGVALIDFARFYGFVYKFRALRINLTAAKRVVTYFAVAHIVIRGKTHGVAVRFEAGVGALFEKSVKRGGIRESYGVTEPGF